MRSIATARLNLTPIAARDVDVLHAMWTDPDVRRYLWDDIVIPRERAQDVVDAALRAAARNGRGMWLVGERDAADAAPVGFCGFMPHDERADGELVYGFLARAWGRGYATESARAIVDYGFVDLGLKRIVAATDVPNGASIRVLERLGMRFVRRGLLNGLDTVFYEVTTPSGSSLRSRSTTG